jgi:hypothetical protein
MRVKIKKASSENSWYTDLIGHVIDAMFVSQDKFYFISVFLYFYPEDVEETTEAITIIADTYHKGLC